MHLLTDNTYKRLYKSTLLSLTDKQRKALSNRINNDQCIPVAIYKHNKSNTIILAHYSVSVATERPFYNVYWDNGQEIGKGTKFFNYRNESSYTMLVDFKSYLQEII